jgi:hypothetical protein
VFLGFPVLSFCLVYSPPSQFGSLPMRTNFLYNVPLKVLKHVPMIYFAFFFTCSLS